MSETTLPTLAISNPLCAVCLEETDGTPNVNSKLYGEAWLSAKHQGYTRLITYTQAGETGASLRGAGWRVIAERPAHPGWDRPSRPRTAKGNEGIQRTLWEVAS